MKIVDILSETVKKFESVNIANPFYEARILLEYAIQKSKEWIMIHINDRISEEKVKLFNDLVAKRTSGYPLQYIIGTCGFMGNEFFVTEAVLIPRSDTEVWLEKVIYLAKSASVNNVLDLCTGSGCIGITIKKNLGNINVYGVDISEDALEIAKKNAERNNVLVNFIQSDLFSNVPQTKFDMIVSNPPYIPSNDIKSLEREVLNEPVIALDGGNDGLDFYRKIVKDGKNFLNEDGYLIFEFGYDQADEVIDILKQNDFRIIEIIRDYSGNNRAVISQKRSKV